MSREQIGKIIGIVLTMLVALLGAFGYDVGVIQPREEALRQAPIVGPESMRALTTDFTSLKATTLTVTGATALNGGLTMDTSAFTVADTSGNTSIAGTLGVGGAATLAGLNKLTAGTAITVTNGAAFTVTASMQPITAAGSVTPTLTIPTAGVYACVYNTSSNAILIQDTGNQVLTADATLGQYDLLCGYSDGTRFIETGRADN